MNHDTDHTTELSSLLQEQYRHVEEYCNAQTRLLNSTIQSTSTTGTRQRGRAISSSSSIDNKMETNRAVAELSNAVTRVRQDLRRLISILEQHSNDNNNHPRMISTDLLGEHINLSRRVIQTISYNPSFHSIGIPSTVNMEANMVSLASLKASIARISEYNGMI